MAEIVEEIGKGGRLVTKMQNFTPEDPACLCYERLNERMKGMGVSTQVEATEAGHAHEHGHEHTH